LKIENTDLTDQTIIKWFSNQTNSNF